MDIHLIDGTYELFRYFYAVPSSKNASGEEIGAVRGVLGSILTMIEGGATHIGVATDHVIESFRNDLYPGYKTGEGVDPALLSQFPILEKALQSMGVLVWPMVKFEADDALASAAAKAAKDKRVRQVIICTPDKDLSQCVVRSRVVQLDRRRNSLRDEPGVIAKLGIKPSSIPDYLAVVGDSADGFPVIKSWWSTASKGGGQRRRRPSSRDIHIWKIFRKTGITGIRQCGERVPLLRRFSQAGTMHSCFVLSRHFESMFACSGPLTSCGGAGLARI